MSILFSGDFHANSQNELSSVTKKALLKQFGRGAVFVVLVSSGEGDVVGFTPCFEVSIDNLAPLLLSKPLRGMGKPSRMLWGASSVYFRALFLRVELRPAGGDIGEAQGEDVLILGEAAVVGNDVNFAKSGFFIVLSPENSDGNLVFELCSGLGGPFALTGVPFPLPPQHPFYRGPAHLGQLHLYLGRYLELAGQSLQVRPDNGDQALPTEAEEELPNGQDGFFYRFIIIFG